MLNSKMFRELTPFCRNSVELFLKGEETNEFNGSAMDIFPVFGNESRYY